MFTQMPKDLSTKKKRERKTKCLMIGQKFEASNIQSEGAKLQLYSLIMYDIQIERMKSEENNIGFFFFNLLQTVK